MIRACSECGTFHRIPEIPSGFGAFCRTCGCRFFFTADVQNHLRRLFWGSLASLMLLIPGFWLPIMQIERFGYRYEAGIIQGAATLCRDGHPVLGLLIFFCSVFIPLLKLSGILLFCYFPLWLRDRRFFWVFRFMKWSGKWGMLDVFVVAGLAASVKLGEIVSISPTSGAWIFSLGVITSLWVSSRFEPAFFFTEHSFLLEKNDPHE